MTTGAPEALSMAVRLQDRVVLITGAGGTIGLESASRLLQEGARLSLLDISTTALDKAMEQLKPLIPADQEASSRIIAIKTDVTVAADMEAATAKTVDTFGRLDCAFLNAGISYSSTSIFDTTEELYEKLMAINVKSAFLGIRATGKAMRDLGNGGSIIITSSIAGLRGTPGLILYSGSKYAVRGFAQTAANELGQYGIRVNTIHPSGVDGVMFRNTWSPEKLQSLLDAMPLGRFAQASDISSVVAFLASDDSKFMTGGFMKVDGGCINF
ncbi:unnamed protein product [Clonostachys byssicola]|uniref:NAD(P)-binding protein n=1 Tax=Clonostachys byssicola TaxID=160290 RepID=A0A9N9UKQ0_9HYPO|nr:unnamed protein product [Clonostachys byssicola]